MLHIKNSIDNIVQNQITFINNYILDCIKREPYYYESMEELYLWLYDIKYNEEATKLIDWCLACKNIAFKIQTTKPRRQIPSCMNSLHKSRFVIRSRIYSKMST